MGLLSWILVGLIAGWLTGKVMGSGYGLWGDMLLGIVGALVGGFIARALFGNPDPLTGFNFGTLLVAFLGSVIVVAISRALRGRRAV